MTQLDLFRGLATLARPLPEVSQDLLDLSCKVAVWYVVGPMASGEEIHYLVKKQQVHPCISYEDFKRDRDRTHALKVVGGFFSDSRSAIKCADFHNEMALLREERAFYESVVIQGVNNEQ